MSVVYGVVGGLVFLSLMVFLLLDELRNGYK